MDKFDRIQQLHRVFKSRRMPVSKRELVDRLECTERNITRLIETLKIVDAPLKLSTICSSCPAFG